MYKVNFVLELGSHSQAISIYMSVCKFHIKDTQPVVIFAIQVYSFRIWIIIHLALHNNDTSSCMNGILQFTGIFIFTYCTTSQMQEEA